MACKLNLFSLSNKDGGNTTVIPDPRAVSGIGLQHVSKVSSAGVPADSAFGNFLKGAISARENAFKPASPPEITTEQLSLLLRVVKMQLNSRLLRSDFNTGGGSNYPAIPLPVFDGRYTNSPSGQARLSPPHGQNLFSGIIQQAAHKYDLDPALLSSVIKAESGFNPGATSKVGAMGLMQLMPDTAKELGVKNPFDPSENILAGARYLKMLLNRYGGELNLALAAYNWGMGNLEKSPGRLPDETISYIQKVNSYLMDTTG